MITIGSPFSDAKMGGFLAGLGESRDLFNPQLSKPEIMS